MLFGNVCYSLFGIMYMLKLERDIASNILGLRGIIRLLLNFIKL